MHSDVAKLVEAGRIPEVVGQRLSEIAPGEFCTHKNWGAGKVVEWDLPGGKVVINFEKQPNQEMDLQFALNKTEPLDRTHFSAHKLEHLDELRRQAICHDSEQLAGTAQSAPDDDRG